MHQFIKELDRQKALEQMLQNKHNTVSTLRFIAALAGIALIVFEFTKLGSRLIYPAFFCVAVFIGLVFWHINIGAKLKKIRCLIKINQDYIDRHNGAWIEFQDLGSEFEDSNHAYTGDLDVFGSHSLFQLINCSSTFMGRSNLAELLKNPEKNIGIVKKRQGAVRELSGKIDFCRELQCEGKLQDETGHSPEKLIAYSKRQDRLFRYKWQEWLIIFLSMASIMTTALLVMKIAIPVLIPVILFPIQGIVTLLGWKCRAVFNEVMGMKRDLETYRSLLEVIRLEDFENEHLGQLKKDLFNDQVSAVKGLKKLDYITGAIDVKFSPVLHFILNIITLWDYHCVFELESWKEQYGRHIEKWIEAIGKFEAYTSLAVIPQISSQFIFPEFSAEGMIFSAENLGHPLINESSRVANNINMQNNICIITGSNMSGKTTMLRTVGINLVLAYAGAPVIAKSMRCSMMDLFTSMRIKDDLSSGISTFYAELLRIKTIVEFSLLKKPMIFLLDEIFRGTNSRDRIIGAKSVISNLNRQWIIGLVSTHDFELCSLENEGKDRIKNFHFTEYYVDDKIRFDYKLKSGRCETTNAKYLMKLAGITLRE